MSSITISIRIWILTSVVFGLGFVAVSWYHHDYSNPLVGLLAMAISAVGSLPALLVLLMILPLLKRFKANHTSKWQLLFGLLLLTCLPYGIIASAINVFGHRNVSFQNAFETCLAATAILFACNTIAVAFSYKEISSWIIENEFPFHQKTHAPNATLATQHISNSSFSKLQTATNMNQIEAFSSNANDNVSTDQSSNGYNKTLIKALITAGLILAMLIPVAYITSLVQEREQRHKEVVQEVSGKWASAQTITTPYLCIPYLKTTVNDTGKQVVIKKTLFLPANNLDVKARLNPEVRKRSIYNVLLYKSDISLSGNIALKPGSDIKPEELLYNEARLFIGITDLKGIEENIIAKFNCALLEMEPALPAGLEEKTGLSAPVILTPGMLSITMPFSMDIKLKGSEQLHFLPVSNNSQFAISSTWPNPSFDGSSLPKERSVTKDGFVAKWSFNKANMPLLSPLAVANANKESMSFGVSMVQPADQYAKTNRSVKYAILFIGLTFSMFFIIELLQQKKVHPVQYVLIGIALVIFYTLLLSIGEFTGFNIAYGIAALCTVSLIGGYSKSLFSSLKTSVLLSVLLGMLYGFIYVLIQLEDTALLAGSIGLFLLLAAAMHFSKKINWYGTPAHTNPAIA